MHRKSALQAPCAALSLSPASHKCIEKSALQAPCSLHTLATSHTHFGTQRGACKGRVGLRSSALCRTTRKTPSSAHSELHAMGRTATRKTPLWHIASCMQGVRVGLHIHSLNNSQTRIFLHFRQKVYAKLYKYIITFLSLSQYLLTVFESIDHIKADEFLTSCFIDFYKKSCTFYTSCRIT